MKVLKAKEMLRALCWKDVGVDEFFEIQSILQQGMSEKFGGKYQRMRGVIGKETEARIRFEESSFVINTTDEKGKSFFRIEAGSL